MKKILAYSLGTALALVGLVFTLAPTVRTYAVLEVAQTFSAIKTFTADLKTTGAAYQAQQDLTLTAPTTAPSGMVTSATAGTCTNTRSYRFYAAWGNQSGITTFGPVSSPDYTPTAASKKVTLTFTETPPANATFIEFFFSHSTDSHAAIKRCGGITAGTIATSSVLVGTTTFDCSCQATSAQTNANSTGILALSKFDSTGQVFGTQNPFTSGGAVAGLGTVDKNRLRLQNLFPEWSNDSGSTFGQIPVMGNANVMNVCTAGCQFSTVANALAAITDASSTKRYAILVWPGIYGTAATMKSYVSIVGMGDPPAVQLQGASTTSCPVLVANNITEAGFYNLWMTGGNGLCSQVSATDNGGATIYVHNSWLGSTDGSNGLGGGNTTIAFDEGGNSSNRVIYFSDVVFNSVQYGIAFAANSTYSCRNCFFNINPSAGSALATAITGISGNGIRFTGSGGAIYMTDTGTTALTMTGISFGTSAVPGQTAYLRWNGPIELISTHASHTAAMTGVEIGAAEATFGGVVDLTGTTVRITSAAATETLTGLKIGADADHAAWSVNWGGGQIGLSGGGTRNTVTNAETVAGFKLKLDGVINATLPSPPTSCDIGDKYTDTSGAFCTCSAANTWTNTNGVGACT